MKRSVWLLILVAITVGAVTAVAQRDFSKVEIKPTEVAPGIWMLKGAGGNIGVCAGADGVLLIDDQFAELSEKIKAAVASVSKQPIRFLLNTHWHGDHTGGNENFAAAGATIFAHDSVRRRMSAKHENPVFGSTSEASPEKALPIVTFADSVTFHVNGEDVMAFHVAPAHTDGDVIVWFRKANVLHVGDCLFNGGYPVIDVSSGGSVAGMIAAADRILAIANDDTKIIPGHGPLATRADVVAFRSMLATSRERMAKWVSEGKTLEQIQAAKPLADIDATWGVTILKPDVWLKVLWSDLSRK